MCLFGFCSCLYLFFIMLLLSPTVLLNLLCYPCSPLVLLAGTAKSKGFDLKGISVKEVSNITGSS
jgi:hypothetical protein